MYHFIAPDLITVHGRKLLQEGVDSLIDNARLPKERTFFLNNKAFFLEAGPRDNSTSK